MSNKETANIILGQLGGGNRLAAMIGAKNFMNDNGSLTFKWSSKAKNKANYVKVTLNENDLYNIKFYYIRGTTIAERETFTDVYCGDLRHLFESTTGLYLSL